jgi:hypothetical protein
MWRLPKVRIFFKRCCPSEKSQPQRRLCPPNALPREGGVKVGNENFVKSFDLKRLSFEGIQHNLSLPPQPILREYNTLKKRKRSFPTNHAPI